MGIKRALAVAAVLDRMSIHILDGELIVGNHASKPRAAPLFPEFDVRYLEEELEGIGTRAGDRFHISLRDAGNPAGDLPLVERPDSQGPGPVHAD